VAQIVKPLLPSTVVQFLGDTIQAVPPSFNAVVAIPIVHDWGPLGADSDGGKLVASLSAFESLYGTGDTAGRTAVVGAFNGMGLADSAGGGAGGVIPYRMATASAAAATKTLQNTAGVPADAITFTAIYKGTRGNDISVVIEDDPVDATKDRARVLFRGATVEQFSYAQADITALAAAITNRPSRWLVPSAVTTGTALAHGTFALAAGNDGTSSLTSAEWQAALDAFEYADFGIFAPYDLTDTAVKAQIVSWLQTMASEMRPARGVFGGAAGEAVDDAITDAALMRDPHVIRFGVGTYHDDLLDKDLSTSQLAARLAGVLAARGEKAALTRALLGGLSLVGSTGATTDELVAGRDAGVTMLRRVTNANADLAVSQGVTTFIDRDAAGMPYELFSEPRIVGLFDNIIRRMVQWGDEVIIGNLPVTDDTRALVRKEVTKILNGLEADGLAQPGSSSVSVEPSDDPGLADAIPYDFAFVPSRTANYLIGSGRVR
jgi:hypothetical protein